MIDVSKFTLAQLCPRCLDRRVVGIREDWNEWCCAPSAKPILLPGDFKIHDANSPADDVQSTIELQQVAQARLIENAKPRGF